MSDASLTIKIGAETKDAVKEIKNVEFTLNDATKALKELKANRLEIRDDGQLVSTNKRIADLTQTIKQLERAGTTGFDSLGQAIGKTKSPLNEAYSDIRKLAYAIPGIGIGGLIALGFEALAAAAESLIPMLNGVGAAQSLVNKTMAEGTGKVAGEVTELKDLVEIATNEANSRDLRRKALAKLQEEYPNAFKNMTIEKTSTEDLTTAYNKLSVALVRQAQIKGLEAAISKVSAEQAELLAGSMEDVVKSAGVLGVIKSFFSNNPTGIFLDQLNSSQDKLNKLGDSLKQLLKTSLVLDDAKLLGPLPKIPKIKVEPEIDEERLKEKPLLLGTLLDTSNFDEKIKTFQGKINKHAYTFELTPDIQKIKDQREEMDAIAQKLADSFSKTLNSALESGVEAIGKNAVGGSIKSLFTDLESIIGDGLESLGKSLLATYPIIKLAKEAIEAALYDPELIAIAGVLAIAAGAAIKGIASKGGMHAFAEGGIVTGPTNALIGEAGPEVVFPLHQLNRFVRNNTGPSNTNVNVRGIISGTDLQLVLARTSKNQRLV